MNHNFKKIGDKIYFLLNNLNFLFHQVKSIKDQVGELGEHFDAIDESQKDQRKIAKKRQRRNRKSLARINRRQKELIEKAEAAITKDELKQEIERLTTSIKNLESTTEDIVSRGATKSDITTAIGNLQVTQQITQQATVPQVGITWYYV